MGVGFVVLKENVKPGLVLFDQVRLEHEGLNLIIYNNKLKIGDHPHELPRLRVVIAARVKIAADPVTQILGLADIYDLPGRIFVDVNAGRGR